MTPKTWLLLSWILVGAGVLVVHLAVFLQALRGKERWRWLALFPPAAPVLAWRAGGRVGPLAWVLFVVGYVVLRAIEGRV